MRLLFTYFLSLFISSAAFAQPATDSLTNNILTTKLYRKGLYKTLQEFKTNSPSETGKQWVVTERSESDIYWAGGNRYKLFIKSTDEQHDRVVKGEYWGFCDGENLYIRMPGVHVNLEKIEVVGLYCYYSTIGQKNSGVIVTAGIFGGAIGAAIAVGISAGQPWVSQPHIININSGVRATLTNKLANQLLEKDLELMAKYGPVENYQGDPSYFVEEYNQRHPELVKPF